MSNNKSRFYTSEQLGPNQALTPEGFLVCTDVPVARTGSMMYGANEVPVASGRDGTITIHRDEDAVFHDNFLASLLAKPVVNDHPPTDVTPENYKKYEIGVGINPRRGSGMQSDLILMDLVIRCPDAIDDVKLGKRQISLGYDADYEEIKPGEGRQVNLIGNHIALVPEGRCGSRCAIGDKQTLNGETKMAAKKTTLDRILDRVKRAFKDQDEEQMQDAIEEVKEKMKDAPADEGSEPSDGSHVHVHLDSDKARFSDDDHEEAMKKNDADHAEFRARLDALEGKKTKDDTEALKEEEMKDAESEKEDKKDEEVKDKVKDDEPEPEAKEDLKEEAPEGTGDMAMKAKDSAFMQESFQETLALAEILSPGIQIPTFDYNASPTKTLDSICALRRSALDSAYKTEDGKEIISQLTGSRELKLEGMKCNQVRTIFRAAASMKKTVNKMHRTTGDNSERMQVKRGLTLADINKRNAEIYKI